jgi:hypothetical protein
VTHLDKRIWESSTDGLRHIHVLWGDRVYTGRMVLENLICFEEHPPEGVLDMVHEYFRVPAPEPDYTLAA